MKNGKRKLNLLLCILPALVLSGCGQAKEAELVPAAEPTWYAVSPRTTPVIRGDLVPAYSARLDLLGYEVVKYRLTRSEFDEFYGTYRMTLDQIHVSVGDAVKKGDVLVSFHSEVLDQRITDNERVISEAGREIEHLRKLMRIDPSLDYGSRITQLNRSIEVARLYIADVKETYGRLNLVAGEDGHVSYISGVFIEGYIAPDMDMIRVETSKRLYTVEKKAEYSFHTGEQVTAKLRNVEYPLTVVDPPEGENPDLVYFRPEGMDGELLEKNLMLEFELAPLKDVCYVNRQAVYDKDGKYFVYTVDENEMRHAVIVEPGDRVGNYLIIKSGLNGGELVELP